MKHGAFLIFLIIITGIFPVQSQPVPPASYDVVVYGGNASGVVAAVSASRMGKRVLLIEPGLHLGGLTSGGLGATDIGNKYAVTGIARDFYRRNGRHYGQFEQWMLEPHVAETLFNDYISSSKVTLLMGYRLSRTFRQDNRIAYIEAEPVAAPEGATRRTLSAQVFIDCSYEGDLLAQAGVSYTIGREYNRQYGETLNGVQLKDKHQFEDGIDPYNMPGNPVSGLVYGVSQDSLLPEGTGDRKVQTYNYRLCLTKNKHNQVPITRPERYDSNRYELLRRVIVKREREGRKVHLDQYLSIIGVPNGKTDVNNNGPFSTDLIGVSWNYPEANPSTRARIIQEHMDYTKGLLYFLAHDERVPAWLRAEMREWGWAKDEFTDNGGFPTQLYIREGRRMIGEYVMTEHHCRGKVVVSDPIALAAYTMDSHNCQRLVVNGMVKNEGDVQVGGFPPYPISYHALTPKEAECANLLVPVCLSASHIAYGSIRMEPVFMVTGQVSGMAAAMAIDQQTSVQAVNVTTLQEKMATDPLLDGSTPDVLVDDSDSSRLEIRGTWKKAVRFMAQYKNGYLLSQPDSDTARLAFKAEFTKPGKYHVYLFNPSKPDKSPDMATAVPVNIHHAGGTATVTVNCRQGPKEWKDLGVYSFEAGQPYSVEIVADKAGAPVPADAVLFVKEPE